MRIYERAQDLWPILIKQAGLNVSDRPPRFWRVDREQDYDAGLLQELHAKLFPDSQSSFAASIKATDPPMPAETLLRAFFQALQPFSLMKLDILEMMAAASARASDEKIRIRFQLNESKEPLDLLLNEFREQMETMETKLVTLSTRTWSNSDLWAITRIAKDILPEDTAILPESSENASLKRWIEQSQTTRRFERFPETWRTGVVAVDQRLQQVVGLVQEILAALGRYGEDYNSARKRIQEIAPIDTAAPLDVSGFDLRQLYYLESDFWLSAIAQWILKVRLTLSENAPAGAADIIMTELDELIPKIRQSDVEREEIVRQLTDILNLPVWKQRHAVYAVWIASQIWRSLEKDWKFRFHLDGNMLSFAFSGVHLATITHPKTEELLDWWTELRTSAVNLPSKKRTRGIQPDYRIRRPPFSAIDSDVLVVEVKQYKRSSTKEFAGALMDYAFACQRAEIVLASYGPISEHVLDAVPAPYRSRTHLAEQVRPDQKQFCQALHEKIRTALSRINTSHSRKIANPKSSRFVGRAELRWKERPSDLDLHLVRDPTTGQKQHVYYAARDLEDIAQLVDDIQGGYGPEIMTFQNPVGEYLLCVHRYSDDGSWASSKATITLYEDTSGKNEIATFHCPTIGNERWWAVCILDFNTGTARPVDRLVEEIWAAEN